MIRSPQVADAVALPTSHVPTILVLVDFYPPAYRAGGPTRSVPRIAEQLADRFRFLVMTRDRDLGATSRLEGITSDRWIDRGAARCLYHSRRRRLLGSVVLSARATAHDILYVNSFFSVDFGLIPLLARRLRLIPRRGLVIAPRGELDDSALALKRGRKRLFLWLARRLSLHAGAIWHAANQDEARAIARHVGSSARILVATDIPMQASPDAGTRSKRPGSLEMVFLSRISRMKNLEFAIASLMTAQGEIHLDVYGPIEDEPYWEECQRLAAQLPATVTFTYSGVVDPEDILGVLGRHHLLFLPSHAESFGHVIAEALNAGCPVLIGDKTPWHGLEARNAGWEFPLSGPELFRGVIAHCVDMTQEEFDTWSAGARRLGREIADDPARDAAYVSLFQAALGATGTATEPTHG